MTSETTKLKAKLATLTSSFDDLESLLEPLFSQTLPETLVGLESIQQAKLQTVLPYLVYDLIFIYLKSRGIDPKSHPVISELDRIRQYFEKISNAENPPAKRTEIDKAAATRFIKHAIAQSQWKKTPAEESQDANDDESDGQNQPVPSPRVPVKVTQKMREREAYEKEMKERDAMASSDDELEVFDGENKDVVDDTRMDVDIDHNRKGKGKQVAPPTEGLPSSKNKRRRPPIDPFAGYGDDVEAPSTSAGFKKLRSSSPPLPSIQNTEQKSSSNTPTISRRNTPLENSKANKKKKKAKKTG
ncbi:hypothetical protein M413DRAFT_439227, partial [Hebeloma cylindrosporum]